MKYIPYFWIKPSKYFWIPITYLVLFCLLIPYWIRHNYIYTTVYVFVGILSFMVILRAKSLWPKDTPTLDKILTIPIYILIGCVIITLAVPVFILIMCGFVYYLGHIIAPIISYFAGAKIILRGKFPKGFRGVIVSNHTSRWDDVFDFIFMSLTFWKVLFAAEVKRIPLVRFFLLKIGIPINRNDEKSRFTSMRTVYRASNSGYNILIKPEGRRLFAERLRRRGRLLLTFEDGAFDIAIKMKLSIIPVVLCWPYLFQPRSGQKHISARTIEIFILDSVTPFGKTTEELRAEVYSLMENKLSEWLWENEPEWMVQNEKEKIEMKEQADAISNLLQSLIQKKA